MSKKERASAQTSSCWFDSVRANRNDSCEVDQNDGERRKLAPEDDVLNG